MKIRLINISKLTKSALGLGIIIPVMFGISTQLSYAENNQPIQHNKTPDIIKNTLNLIPTVKIGVTEEQLEIIRSFLINNVNKVPGLNLTQQQINAILSYFDLNPTALKVNLTQQQIQALRNSVLNNLNQIASLRLSPETLSTVVTIITNNSGNISSLINNNPEIASLIRSIAPQINQIATVNQQLEAIISILRTTVPELNALLAV